MWTYDKNRPSSWNSIGTSSGWNQAELNRLAGLLMLISAAAIPLALILRKVKLGGPAAVAH